MKKNFVFIMLVVSLVFGVVGNTTLWGQAEPKTAEEFNNRARMFMIYGDYDRAIADCTQAIRLNPNSIDAYKRRGTAYTANEDYNRAIADFTQAIKLSPHDADAYTSRGVVYMRIDDWAKAFADYGQAIRIKPNDQWAYYRRAEANYTVGYVLDNKKDFENAIEDYTQAIRINPKFADAYLNRGHAYKKIKDYDRAIADYEEVLKISPYNTTAKGAIESTRQEKQKSSPASQPAAPPAQPAPAGMVYVRGGTFMMGSPANEPERVRNETAQRQVTVNSFYMGKYEVTQKEWQEIMGYNPSNFKGDNLPVEQVSCYDAIEYCNKRSQKEGLTPAYKIDGFRVTWNRNANDYRLPTAAEWEYACRAGTTTPFNTGNNITTQQANYDGNYPYNNNPKGTSRGRTMPVGSFAPNAWGLYDMHGNVAEWCYDLVNEGDATQDYRGGSWDSGGKFIRSGFGERGGDMVMSRNNDLGFRVVRNAQ